MRKCRIIGMIMVAVLMCANFTSCSKIEEDDKPAEEEIVKKLIKFTTDNGSIKTEILFNYDENGRLRNSTEKNLSGDDMTFCVTEYTWSENKIEFVSTRTADYIENITVTLENGLAQWQSEDYLFGQPSTYKYDTSNRLIETTRSSLFDMSLVWEDNKLITLKNKNTMLGTTRTFEYGQYSTVGGYVPLIPHRVGSGVLYTAHPELGGMYTNQAPIKETNTGLFIKPQTSTYEYEYDIDGYITKIIETAVYNNDPSNVYTFIYTATWIEFK